MIFIPEECSGVHGYYIMISSEIALTPWTLNSTRAFNEFSTSTA